ncbi:hypothetical protein NIES4071_39030 [Calothrix sp. NIES-4071]|nr:hypothetical protein NIES4071_39030 [Calothrix sp. NIES-4071]BAZ58221.1 hypothetical protein NIES4105_38970 [Calothrix sp. NIES-4105]
MLNVEVMVGLLRACKPFLNLFNAPWLSHEALLTAFGTSTKKVAIELFRINGGKQGYYIANIQG